MNRHVNQGSVPDMLKVTKSGVWIERAVLQALLNLIFEDAREKKAVICVDASDEDHPRIYSTASHA